MWPAFSRAFFASMFRLLTLLICLLFIVICDQNQKLTLRLIELSSLSMSLSLAPMLSNRISDMWKWHLITASLTFVIVNLLFHLGFQFLTILLTYISRMNYQLLQKKQLRMCIGYYRSPLLQSFLFCICQDVHVSHMFAFITSIRDHSDLEQNTYIYLMHEKKRFPVRLRCLWWGGAKVVYKDDQLFH